MDFNEAINMALGEDDDDDEGSDDEPRFLPESDEPVISGTFSEDMTKAAAMIYRDGVGGMDDVLSGLELIGNDLAQRLDRSDRCFSDSSRFMIARRLVELAALCQGIAESMGLFEVNEHVRSNLPDREEPEPAEDC